MRLAGARGLVEIGPGAPRLGGEAAVYDAVADGVPCVVKVAHAPSPHGDWLDGERATLLDLAAAPATAPLVPRVLDHGRWDGRPFVALERFAGSVADALAGPLSPADRLALALRIARAVARLREARPRLVHRDLKPANLLLDGDRVVIADFGVAREPVAGHTTTTRALLTPDYAAPEQSLPGRRPDRSWDAHGLAATVFHVLTGAPPAAPARAAGARTPRGLRLRAGRDDGAGHAWDYLDLSGPGLAREERAALDRTYEGPAADVLGRALAPDPRRRGGSPFELRDALAATRVRLPEPAGNRVKVAVAALAIAIGAAAAVRSDPPAPYPLVPIPAGRAEGADGGVVTVPAFALGTFEVDQALFAELGGTPLGQRRKVEDGAAESCRSFLDVPLEGGQLPMVCVDWLDAVRTANALSRREGLAEAYAVAPDGAGWRVDPVDGADGYRLPTVAELRRALDDGAPERPACAGNVGDRRWTAHFPTAAGATCDDGAVGLAPVGSHPPDAFGVHDLRGNVSEWTADPGPGDRHHVFGSAYTTPPKPTWAAPLPSTWREVQVGLRLARDLP